MEKDSDRYKCEWMSILVGGIIVLKSKLMLIREREREKGGDGHRGREREK